MGSEYDWLKQISSTAPPIRSPTQTELASDTSSVWNFWACSRDFFSQENQCWHQATALQLYLPQSGEKRKEIP